MNLNANVKKCRVCGDHTSVFYNYDGLSCKSCKKFFLRHAKTIKVFKCKSKNDNCPMTIASRKYCKKCRMNKCLEIGMKKELTSPRKMTTDNQMIELTKTKTNLKLESYELKRIEEVQAATSTFNIASDYKIEGQIDTFHQVVTFADYYARNYVKFCKKNSTFKSLSKDDQIVLLKCSFREISSIYVAFYYDFEKDGIPIVVLNESGEQKVYFRKFGPGKRTKLEFKKGNPVYNNFVICMKNAIENDITIRDLIFAQLLFKIRPGLSAHEFVHYNHLLYGHLLRRYLEHKFNDSIQAKSKHGRIVSLLNQIENVTKNVHELYEKLGVDQVPQLLAEIYNLK